MAQPSKPEQLVTFWTEQIMAAVERGALPEQIREEVESCVRDCFNEGQRATANAFNEALMQVVAGGR